MIFALLDSAKHTGLRDNSDGGSNGGPNSGRDDNHATGAMTRSKKSSLLWQMYYAKPDGTVLGVSQFNDPSTADSSSPSWQCWGGTNGTHVRRTHASTQCGWNSLLDAQQDQNISTYYAYEYDARVRPWYTRAMNSPGIIVWTKPCRFKATGYMGLTAAVATRIGGGFRHHPPRPRLTVQTTAAYLRLILR